MQEYLRGTRTQNHLPHDWPVRVRSVGRTWIRCVGIYSIASRRRRVPDRINGQ